MPEEARPKLPGPKGRIDYSPSVRVNLYVGQMLLMDRFGVSPFFLRYIAPRLASNGERKTPGILSEYIVGKPLDRPIAMDSLLFRCPNLLLLLCVNRDGVAVGGRVCSSDAEDTGRDDAQPLRHLRSK